VASTFGGYRLVQLIAEFENVASAAIGREASHQYPSILPQSRSLLPAKRIELKFKRQMLLLLAVNHFYVLQFQLNPKVMGEHEPG
jgi:hypothetical protein